MRNAVADDAAALAELIHRSTNDWYRTNLGHEVFACPPEDVRLFVDVYESLDPGRCMLLEDSATGSIAGSCFVHPRPSHVSLGILNVDSAYAGRGVARRLVQAVIDLAEESALPVRLVSSAMNLDSYSLYTRMGFVPYAFFQDMLIQVPENEPALDDPQARAARDCIRPANHQDVAALVELEMQHLGIQRPDDLAYFIDNAGNGWHMLVAESEDGTPAGYLAAIDHPASRIIGPGCAEAEHTMVALIAAQLGRHSGRSMLVVAPADRPALIQQLYRWGARNCETHVAQCRPASGSGTLPKISGVFLPTYLPETA